MLPINLISKLKKCTICPRECAVDRTKGANGFCRANDKAEVYSAHLHFGEEPPISGTEGSGTIFFSHCNLRCVYCQNYQLSQIENGKEFEIDELSALMLSLQQKGAHNINFVTPTHYALHVINAVIAARKNGLNIPIVYNTSGYEKIETLRLLNGLVDVYLVDMRYGDNNAARKYSHCDDYVEINRLAMQEMHRQVGDLKLTAKGIAESGVIIRHLVLPNGLSGTESIFKFISHSIGGNTYISLMSQYYPAYKACDYGPISRGVNKKEYEKAVSFLCKYGLKNGWTQEYMGGRVDSDFAGTNIKPDA